LYVNRLDDITRTANCDLITWPNDLNFGAVLPLFQSFFGCSGRRSIGLTTQETTVEMYLIPYHQIPVSRFLWYRQYLAFRCVYGTNWNKPSL